MSFAVKKRRKVTEAELRLLQRRCIEMLDAMTHPSAAVRAKRAAKTLLGRAGAKETDPLFWPAGLLLLGLAESGRALPDGDAMREVRAYLRRWMDGGGEVRNLDDALAGVAALRLAVIGARESSLPSGDETLPRETASRVFAFLRTAPRDAEGAFLYHPSASSRCVFADGVGMAAMFLREYAEYCRTVTQEAEAADEAEAIAGTALANYQKYGMDSRSGLPYHGYSLREEELRPTELTSADGGQTAETIRTSDKHGLVGWGRAVGFLAMGGLPGLAETVLSYQRQDGLFSWLLPAVEGHADTSATAMLGFALDCLPDRERYSESLVRIESGLLSRLENGCLTDSLAECVDFAEHPQRYGVNPWGMGAGLLFLSLRYCDQISGLTAS